MCKGCFKLDGVMFVFVSNFLDDGVDMGGSGPWNGCNDVHKQLVFSLFFSSFFKSFDNQFSLVFLLLKVQIVAASGSSHHVGHDSKKLTGKFEKLKNFENFKNF